MDPSAFDYCLPPERIAQEPAAERDRSRLLVVRRGRDGSEERVFADLPDLLQPGDVLVVNDSRVIPARLNGRRETGGAVEILLLPLPAGVDPERRTWEALLRPARRLRPGDRILLPEGAEAEIRERISDKKWLLAFQTTDTFDAYLDRHGRPPLPPYIRRVAGDSSTPADRERYQTVYARAPGSVAAPTAGLHFTPAIFADLEKRDILTARLTLHVGYGTFQPLPEGPVENTRLDAEHYELTGEAARLINQARRVVAVGTTSTRVLETLADENGRVAAGEGYTDLFIRPGHRFRCAGAMVTNFHLPRSSLFVLVCAFAGTERMKEAYRRAVEDGFRFYSYGDAMLIL
ncbi:MAG: tRNA preQ1(34) S-adenosylmethionine ribosyltransferase-isomerase QueA [Syntrophaceae bacterium]|nr:tRNA preQ1(34) S-adenosylmethionine ribosyltransferase-isomerase QueA [Syntrophaceae bacterium]